MGVLLGVLAVLFIAFKEGHYGVGLFIIIFIGAVLGIAYLAMPQCPKCQARGTRRHLHQRVDGGPDRRYHYNPEVCGKCDWRSH